MFLRDRLERDGPIYLSGYFLASLLFWAVALLIYVLLLRRALGASPFRTARLSGKSVLPAATATPGASS
jgi:hypothetical protein